MKSAILKKEETVNNLRKQHEVSCNRSDSVYLLVAVNQRLLCMRFDLQLTFLFFLCPLGCSEESRSSRVFVGTAEKTAVREMIDKLGL